jgi:hypothetical protein
MAKSKKPDFKGEGFNALAKSTTGPAQLKAGSGFGRAVKQKGGGEGRQGRLFIHPIDMRLTELGKSRRWLATQIGRSPGCIRAYCNGTILINPSSFLAKRFCRVLEIDLNYLILGPKVTERQGKGQP